MVSKELFSEFIVTCFVADKAIQEMNTKPKKIIAAYSKALKNAHKPESRIRLILAGDSQTGKYSFVFFFA